MSVTTLYWAAEGGGEKPPNPLLPHWYDIIWSSVAFIVVAIVFVKFVMPRIQKTMDERTDLIEGGIARAEAAQNEANEQLAAYRKQLSEARTEAAQIREDARTQGAQILTEMKSNAQDESNRIIEQGHHQLDAQRQQVVAELRGELGQTSVNLAEKLLGQQLTDDVKRAGTVESFLSELDASNTAVGK